MGVLNPRQPAGPYEVLHSGEGFLVRICVGDNVGEFKRHGVRVRGVSHRERYENTEALMLLNPLASNKVRYL